MKKQSIPSHAARNRALSKTKSKAQSILSVLRNFGRAAAFALALGAPAAALAATAPDLMSFQGFLTDGANAPLGAATPITPKVVFRI